MCSSYNHSKQTGYRSSSDIRFNDAQAKAVAHLDGAMLVLAGPGSGKTAVITGRIHYLIHICKIRPEHILTITFTKKAAIEMKQRAIAMNEKAKDAVFGTFHAVFYQILLQAPRYHGMKPCTLSVKRQIMKQILYANHYDTDQSNRIIDKLLNEISYHKNTTNSHNFESKIVPKEQFEQIYQSYNKELHGKGYVDFDDMLLLCFEYLKSDEAARKQWQERFQYIQIDEYQDINGIQYAIMAMLAGDKHNIFAVGDDDQAIYAFRGSDATYMYQFQEDFDPVETVVLDCNYRCHEEIAGFASKCISHNKNRFLKQIKTVHKKGEGVNIHSFQDEKEEAEKVIEKIMQLKKENPNASVALLYRTNRQGRYMEEKLFKEGFWVEKEEKGEDFYEHLIVKDVLAYFSFLQTSSRYDFLMLMNKPLRYISRDALHSHTVTKEEICSFYRSNPQMITLIETLFEDLAFMAQCDAYSACLYLFKKVGYENYIKKQYEREPEQYEEALMIMEELKVRLKEYKSVAQFIDFVKEWQSKGNDTDTKTELKKQREEQPQPQKTVSLMTYHASKGLEFEHVFLTGVSCHSVPHPRAVTEAEMEEERRMFYVAMTRAKQSLWISYTTQNDTREASAFILQGNNCSKK